MTEAAKSSRFYGSLFALATAALLALQEPLSGPGAQMLGGVQFVLITQISLAVAAPMLLIEAEARRDFWAILKSFAGWLHLGGLVIVGLAGLALYNLGLSHAHPVVVTAILNLSPFWAALVARVITGVRIPAGPFVFAASLLVAFAGAMAVVYSQSKSASGSASGLMEMLQKGSWYFAIPVPIFTALSGTLVGLWFKDVRESAAIAAALLSGAAVTIPGCLVYLWARGIAFNLSFGSVALLVVGTILSAALGRLLYQLALSRTDNDNGFVSMFFLLAPGLSGLYSWVLSSWVQSLRFESNLLYFVGLVVTAASLFYFVRNSGQPEAASK